MEITPTNLIIPIMRDDGSEIKIWVSQPFEKEMIAISRVLSYINKQINMDEPLNTLITDWERLVDEAIAVLPKPSQEKVKRDLETFFSRAEASAFIPEIEFSSLSEAEKSIFKGTLLFVSALYRYLYRIAMKSEMTEFFTSQNAMDWAKHLQGESSESTQKAPQVKIGSSVK